jgi:hypothetical protein
MPSNRPESVKDITWQLVNNDPGKVTTMVLTWCYFAYGYHKLQFKNGNGNVLSNLPKKGSSINDVTAHGRASIKDCDFYYKKDDVGWG